MTEALLSEQITETITETIPEPKRRLIDTMLELDPLTDITFEEFNIIHAYQTAVGLDMLEGQLTDSSMFELRNNLNWIDSYRVSSFKGYSEAVKHLKAVDQYYMTHYKEHYPLWFIGGVCVLDWGHELKDRAIKKYGEAKRKKKSWGGIDE